MRAGYVKDQKTYNKKALLRRGNEVYDIDLYQLLNLNKTELNFYLRKEDVLHIQGIRCRSSLCFWRI